MNNFRWKFILVITAVITAILFVIPSIRPGTWPYKKINLGLDLKGGMHVLLFVDTNLAIEYNLNQTNKELRSFIRKNQLEVLSYKVDTKKRMSLVFKNKKDLVKFKSLLKKEYSNLKISQIQTLEKIHPEITIQFTNQKIKQISESTINQALETIRNRIDQFGVNEPEIRKHGSTQILVQLPGITNVERAKELIGRTAYLEFRMVNPTVLDDNKEQKYPSKKIIMYKQSTRNGKNSNRIPIVVSNQAPITGAHLLDARVCINNNKPQVAIKLNNSGAKIFKKLTRENINRQLAIILDGNIYCTPNINEEIPGGEAIISGNFSMEEAKDLAIALRAGSLPAPVKIIEERTVGPSLGSSSIKAGLLSMFAGSIMVFLFMLIYYKISGLVANIALILNIVIIAAGLAIFQATLTLPGIAGIILTIGMAVDANVIIFERIKDEIRSGKPLLNSVTSGYERASITILDANITTMIAAIVLFKFGSGAIKGFSVTLALGILSSLFTSLMVSKMILHYILIKFKNKKKFISLFFDMPLRKN